MVFASIFGDYLALAQLVLWLNDPVRNGASLWPAAGLSLVVLLLLPTRSWGWVVSAIGVGGTVERGASDAGRLGRRTAQPIRAALSRRLW